MLIDHINILVDQNVVGQIKVLRNAATDQFEGYVELLELESVMTFLGDDYDPLDEDPLGWRKERWLVRWCSAQWAEHLKNTPESRGDWFTQLAMQGKLGHRYFYAPTRGILRETIGEDYFWVPLK